MAPTGRKITWVPANLGSSGRDTSGPLRSQCAGNSGDSFVFSSRREPLYSYVDRVSMGRAMMQDVSPHPVDDVLEQLESRMKAVTDNAAEIRLGPFTAFHLQSPATEPSGVRSLSGDWDCSTAINTIVVDRLLSSPNLTSYAGPSGTEAPVNLGNDEPHNPPPRCITPLSASTRVVCVQSTRPRDELSSAEPSDTAPSEPQPSPSLQWQNKLGNSNGLGLGRVEYAGRGERTTHGDSQSRLESRDTAFPAPHTRIRTSSILSEDMITLMNYYRTRAIQSFSPFENDKSPWSRLHLPCVLSTAGCLLVSGEDTPIRLAIFYAALSISAYQLSRISVQIETRGVDSPPSYWVLLASKYRQHGKENLLAGLRDVSRGLKRAKYKEILMALLSMVTVGVVSGSFAEGQEYLFHAQELIQSRLKQHKPLSPKQVLLHNTFLYVRVLERSTFDYTTSSNQPAQMAQPDLIDSEGIHDSVIIPDTTWFRQQTPSNQPPWCCDQLVTALGDSAVFERIYGIPFSIFRLIARVTSVKHMMEARHTTNEGAGSPLAQRVRVLEQDICARHVSPSTNDSQQLFSPTDQPGAADSAKVMAIRFLASAINNAVIVMFYRQILNINPVVIQHYVTKATDDLMAYEEQQLQSGIPGTGIVWPAFIVGCESLLSKDQDRLAAWLLRSAQQSGVRSFDETRQILMSVWHARSAADRTHVIEWQDFTVQHHGYLILT